MIDRFHDRKCDREQIRGGGEIREEDKIEKIPRESGWVPGRRDRVPDLVGEDERVSIYVEIEQCDEVAVEAQVLGVGCIGGP